MVWEDAFPARANERAVCGVRRFLPVHRGLAIVRVMTGYRLEIGIAVCLALLTLGVFWHAIGNDFVNVDDHLYVYQNPYVQAGLTGPSVCWAFTAFETSNWHPLTWLSLEADAQLSGTGPRGFHRTNVLLHAANVVLL